MNNPKPADHKNADLVRVTQPKSSMIAQQASEESNVDSKI